MSDACGASGSSSDACGASGSSSDAGRAKAVGVSGSPTVEELAVVLALVGERAESRDAGGPDALLARWRSARRDALRGRTALR